MFSKIGSGRRMVFATGAALTLLAILGAYAGSGAGAARAKARGQVSEGATDSPALDFPPFNGAVPNPPMVRKDLSSLTDAQLASLRKGVLAMMQADCPGKAAPACEQNDTGLKANNMLDAFGWKYQAFIHGRPTGVTNQPAWNTCQHSTWFFLAWHRMELFFFERILRTLSGDPTLTVPYWNFGVPPKGMSGVGARLPASFRLEMVNGSLNPLWWRYRNDGLSVDNKPLCAKVVTTAQAFAQTAFFSNVKKNSLMSFGGGASQITAHGSEGMGTGQLENLPHNDVHVSVGDLSALSMSSPDGAGLDPIFWPVHANIDRAWSCWQKLHPGTEPKSDAWMKKQFSFFDVQMDKGKPKAVPVSMTGQQIIDTAKQLGYVYDDACEGFQGVPQKTEEPASSAAIAQPSGVETPAARILTASAESTAILHDEPVTVSIPLSREIQARIEALVFGEAPAGSILLTLGGVAVDHPVGASYEVYLGLPRGALADYESDYYVNQLSFFGVGHHHDDAEAAHISPHAESVTYDITGVVRKLFVNGEWTGEEALVTVANTCAATPNCVSNPFAPLDARARFTSVTVTVH
jgi:tyrosinase